MNRPMFLVFNPQAILKLGLVVAIGLTFAGNTARSQLLDPSTLQISGNNTGGTTEPVQIDDTGLLTVTQNSGGASALTNPWLLILGIPNDSTTSYFGNNTSVGFNNPITSVKTTGGNTPTPTGDLGGSIPSYLSGTPWKVDTGYAGSMTSGGEAYKTVGLSGLDSQGSTNSSNSFTNWSGADSTDNNLTVSNFGIYVFEINAALAGKDTATIQFSSLPIGTFAIAYGQNGTKTKGTIYDTPFTRAGLTTQNGGAGPGGEVISPAPSSAILFSLGGLALVGFMARSRRRLLVAA